MDEKEKMTSLRKEYLSVVREFNKAQGTPDEKYWQGRKDGMRAVIAIADLKCSIDAADLNESSSGYRCTEDERTLRLLRKFVYHGAAILYEVEELSRTDLRTRMGLRRAVEWYDRLSTEGVFPVISDHCLSVSAEIEKE